MPAEKLENQFKFEQALGKTSRLLLSSNSKSSKLSKAFNILCSTINIETIYFFERSVKKGEVKSEFRFMYFDKGKEKISKDKFIKDYSSVMNKMSFFTNKNLCNVNTHEFIKKHFDNKNKTSILPLVSNGKHMGFLYLEYNNSFNNINPLVLFLNTFSDIVASYLYRMDIEEQLEQKNMALEEENVRRGEDIENAIKILYKIKDFMINIIQSNNLLADVSALIEDIGKFLDASMVCIYKVEDTKNYKFYDGWTSSSLLKSKKCNKIKLNNTNLTFENYEHIKKLENEKSVVIDSNIIFNNSDVFKLDGCERLKRAIVTPIILYKNKSLWGVITFFENPKRKKWTDIELTAINSFGSLISSIIKNVEYNDALLAAVQSGTSIMENLNKKVENVAQRLNSYE